LNGALLAADILDEINVTISPQLVGGDGPRLTVGAPNASHPFDLTQLCEDEGFLFARYRRRR
jgi:riboflavin biosynthesis pyrimidine reductase